MIKPKLTHKKFHPGRQVETAKGKNKVKAFRKPPVARVGKSKK